MRPQTPVYLFVWITVFTLGLLAMVARLAPAYAQPQQGDPNQATIDAFVGQAFTQTAQAGMPTANVPQTLEAAVLNARTATAAAADSAVPSAATPTPAPQIAPQIALEDLRLASFESYPLAGGQGTSAHLAPSGDIFVRIERQTFCVYTVAGEETGCAELEDERFQGIPDSDSVRWSPDSHSLLFINNAYQTLQDSDIWLFDIETLSFSNLTDDSFAGNLFTSETFNFDFAPVWSPDGEEIAFIRYPYMQPRPGGTDTGTVMHLCFLRLENSEPDCAVLPEIRAVLVALTLDWSPTGDTLAFAVRRTSTDTSVAGLWVYDRAADTAERVAGETRQGYSYRNVEFSPDGENILATTLGSPAISRSLPPPEASTFRVIHLETGAITFVDPARRVWSAGWLPDGGLFYLVQPDSDSGARYTQFYANDAPNTEGRLLGSSSDLDLSAREAMLLAPTGLQIRPLLWSAQNSVLLAARGQKFFLLTFAQQ